MVLYKHGVIGFPSPPSKKGGPGSFQDRFEKHIRAMGWQVVYPDNKHRPDIILVNGSTKHIWWLLKAKFNGAHIVYRLGGINWLYKHKSEISKIKKVKTTAKHSLISITQKVLGDAIIYQSEFSKKWLIKLGQSARLKNNIIIYNGVDIDTFKPDLKDSSSKRDISLICVEGNLDYSPYSIKLLNILQDQLVDNGFLYQILLYGDFENPDNRNKLNPSIKYQGQIAKDEISKIYRNAIYLSLDINPACPNAVIEALASGIPVVGFNTGSLNELVPAEAGIIVPYGGDPWKLDFPDVNGLIKAIEKTVMNYTEFSRNARRIAEERYSINIISEKYLNVFLQLTNTR